eukprot:CAMPEP_0174308226 /NCGR_PEP_ID=MMETSP0810-20121108/1615_1 /TAXON_ID=73025 ORGANISM="Eutreptiella gymnastica-like, Strain CCMP1594" /NCGR_SAMPLE_ID=MMETSP0810 /ASSEMBLY_ACC=CAM_ASM_000659 /LENGTH=83 /DNA_ID=CAMNT_0015415481 /DNA_START=804 /DNA_END=1055 /DNA_ORIENTATION=-
MRAQKGPKDVLEGKGVNDVGSTVVVHLATGGRKSRGDSWWDAWAQKRVAGLTGLQRGGEPPPPTRALQAQTCTTPNSLHNGSH